LNDSTFHRQTTPDDAYEKALSFLYGQINYEKMTVSNANRYRFRLQRMSELLQQLGLERYLYSPSSPKPPIPLIHIAGTKGKGSVAAMVAAMLTASGLRTGLYTSPHLHRLEERFRIDGEACPPEQLVKLAQELRQAVVSPSITSDSPRHKDGPSFFELTTALALLYFERSHCQAIVLEVGLGGRLDSTNVCAPSISVVTSIGLDHQHVLGNDLAQIAAEKAGIIKQGVPVVSGVMDPTAQAVVESTAIEHRCTLWQLGRDFDFQGSEDANWGSRLVYTGPSDSESTAPEPGDPGKQIETFVPLEGTHQCRNAAIALATIEALARQGRPISDAAINEGLAGLICPGRIEPFPLSDGVMAVVDVAHNEDSVAALCDCLRNRRANRNIAVVFGTSVDKSAEVMLKQLTSISDEIVLTRFHGNPRFVEPGDLVPLLPQGWTGTAKVMTDPIVACEKALERISPDGILVICGSFFLAAETRPWIMARSQ
jgi:dihydrofolate synthase/folylpolyglutamate synthase